MFHTARLETLVIASAVFAASLSMSRIAQAAEMVMFERAGCVWCQRWDREIAPIYDKTDEAKVLPLRRVDVDRDKPTDITLASPVIYTPTFIVIDKGREIGRIIGYTNDMSFWGLLGKYAAQFLPTPDHT
jgi:thioredoxin-related protein